MMMNGTVWQTLVLRAKVATHNKFSISHFYLFSIVSGSITVKISYVGEKEKRHEFRVLLQEAKDLSASQGIGQF